METERGRQNFLYLGTFSRACSRIFCLKTMPSEKISWLRESQRLTHMPACHAYNAMMPVSTGDQNSRVGGTLEKLEGIQLCWVLRVRGV
jgi:hypothetical protein